MIRKPFPMRRRGAEAVPVDAPPPEPATPGGASATPGSEGASTPAPEEGATTVLPVVTAEPAPPAPDAPTTTFVPPTAPLTPVGGSAAAMPSEQPSAAVPAGLEADAAPAPSTPSFRDRGRLRRRLRYLRRVRELAFRDLGGLLFDLHRFGRDGTPLIVGKLEALAAVDHELRALETVLDEREEVTVLREPGIAACPRCATLHGSEAHFCPNCGLRLSGPQAVAGVVDRRADPLARAAAAGGAAPPVGTPDARGTPDALGTPGAVVSSPQHVAPAAHVGPAADVAPTAAVAPATDVAATAHVAPADPAP